MKCVKTEYVNVPLNTVVLACVVPRVNPVLTESVPMLKPAMTILSAMVFAKTGLVSVILIVIAFIIVILDTEEMELAQLRPTCLKTVI